MSKIITFGIDDIFHHAKALEIRKKVFVEEQNVNLELEIENEDESKHFLLFYNENAVATARYRITEKGVKLERFAMLKEFRGLGLGNDLLEFVIKDAKKLNKHIYLNAQIQVVGYYKKFGFVAVGESFFEANIEHYLMEYQEIIQE